jgi:uncharacterized protein (TIGR02996 family)
MSGALEKGVLADIVANIDDDTPRLVYADWLIENGKEERAEFIRVQIERARLPAWDPAQVRLRLREQALLKKHGEAWLSELPSIKGAKWEGFRRGIVAEVSFASYEAMRAHAHECRAVAPVEAATVPWPRKRESRKAAPPIAELRELRLTGHINEPDEVAILANSPQLATLWSLTVRGLWGEAVPSFFASPHLGNLRTLRLPTNSYTLNNDDLLTLIGTESLTSLQELDLSGWGYWARYSNRRRVESAGIEALADWPGLRNVRSLKLSGNEVGRAGLSALLRSKYTGALKTLSLHSSGLDGQAMSELASAAPTLRLESLDVGENILKEAGVTHLASAPCLRDLKVLRLDRCEIPLSGARKLANAAFLGSLQILDIGYNHFGSVGLDALLKNEPSSLHTLRMRDNNLFDKGAELLAGSPASDGLLEVDLSQNGLRDAALVLGEPKNLSNLLILRLQDNLFKESETDKLKISPLGQRLAVLELGATPSSDEHHLVYFMDYEREDPNATPF